ncbi:MAG: PDZ domain-containing protein [Verrucomicrobia bacterium]|nr:PDZ domain-containing protein [Verrucomicrobiota bacterium]
MNINLFQFERDLTWMSFFMDSQDRFYARYGGREDDAPESHLTKESLIQTMSRALELHRNGRVQQSRYEPGREPVRAPEDIPTMKALLAPRKDNNCIHCHDVKVAELKHLQQLGRFARDLVFTYPAPSAVGIRLDADAQNNVRAVTRNSPAQRAGIREGDILLSADGQRISTFADFTRVLELTPSESALPLEIKRGDQVIRASLELAGSWRRTSDPSWRESLHVAGPNAGFWGQKLAGEERKKLGLPLGKMAVLVTFIWGDYTREAGLKKDDVVIQFDGLTQDMTIPQLHAHLNLNRNYGDRIPLTVRRGGKDHELILSLPRERPKGE